MATITVDLRALTGAFVTDIVRAEKAAKRSFSDMQASGTRMGAALGGVFASVLVGMTALTKGAINTADQLANMSQKVGVSVESLSTLGYAAKQSDVEITQLQAGLIKLAKNASDAAQGTGTAVDAFAALGVSVKQADGALKNTDVLLKELATQFARYEDGANKTALAVGVFGRAGAQLLPLLNEGADGIAELEERARALGLEIGGETAAAAERFNDTLEDSANLMKGLGLDIAEAILPQLNALIDAYVNAGIEGRKTADVTDAIRASFDFLAVTFVKGVEATQNVGAAIGYVVDAISALLGAVKESTGPLATYFDALTDVLSGDLVSGAEKYKQAIVEAANVGVAFGQSVKNSGEALKSSFAANAANAQAKLDAMAESTLDANSAILGTEEAAKRAAPAIVNLAKAEADRAKALKEHQQRERAYAQMLQRAMNEEQDYYARQRKAQEEQAQQFEERARNIKQEISLLGLSRYEREKLAIAIDAENLARDKNDVVVEKQRQRYEDLLTTLQQAQRIEDAAREFEAIWLDAAENVGDALTTALFDGASEGADAIKDVMEQLARDLVRFWLQQKIVIPLQQQLVGGGGGGQGSLGALGGGSMWGQYAGIAMAGAGVGGLIGGNVFGGSRENSTGGAVGGAAGGLIAGTATGAAVIGAGLTAAGVGAALGSVVPIVGTIIGALIGAAIGELFETDPRIRVSSTEQDARFDTAFARGGVARDALPSGTATQFAEAITTFDNTLAAMLGVVEGGAAQIAEIQAELANFEADVSNGGVSVANILQLRFDAILSTFDEDVQAAVRGAGDLQAQVEALAGAFVYPQQIQAALDQLADASEWADMSELERQTAAVNAQFDALVTQFEAWGASAEQMAQVEAYRAAALGRLMVAEEAAAVVTDEAARAYADFVAEFTGGGGSEFQRALRGVQRELDETVDRANELARAAGLQAAREEDLLGARQRANDQIADLIAGLTETVIQQIADLYGTSADQIEQRIAAIDAEIEAMDRSDSTFGMLQNMQREAQLGAERLRLQDEMAEALAEQERIQRRLGAMDLAQNLADLGLARGVAFEDLAGELGLNLDRFGEDLGITASAVGDFIRALEADSLTADVYGQGVQQIVDAIMAANTITDPKPVYFEDGTDPSGRGGKSRWREVPTEPEVAIREEMVALRETVAQQTTVIADLLTRGNTITATTAGEMQQMARAMVRQALDREANRPRNERTVTTRPKGR